MVNRKAGWYWVKLIEGGKWRCFKWNGSAWCDKRSEYPEDIFDVIGPRIPTPDEPWQCVPVEATDEMVEAGYMKIDLKQKWVVMLATAPKPEN